MNWSSRSFGGIFRGLAEVDRIDQRHRLALDTCWTSLYYSYMNYTIAFALMHAGHRVEARVEEALAGVKLSGAKHAALSVLVSQDLPMSLSELAEKLKMASMIHL